MTAKPGTRTESLLKTVTWYVSDSVLTGVVALAVTREPTTALSIAVLQQTIELLWYYAHERAWVKVQARLGGRKMQTDSLSRAHQD